MRGNQLPASAAWWQWFPDMFCNFYLVKNNKIAKISTTTPLKLDKKLRTDLESIEF
jgi:hypothetical protein